MALNDNSFITVQAFMRNDLGLSGNELLAYALIYGFSQDGASRFDGTASYVAEWCGIARENATRLLGRLVDKGLLDKEERRMKDGHKHCSYAVTKCRNVTNPSDETSLSLVTKRHRDIDSINKYRDIKNPYSPLVEQVVTHLNERTGSSFRATTRETAKAISGRASEGYTLDDFKSVIDTKASEWGRDAKMRKYLTPQTLFRQSNFERYVNEARAPKAGGDFSAYN